MNNASTKKIEKCNITKGMLINVLDYLSHVYSGCPDCLKFYKKGERVYQKFLKKINADNCTFCGRNTNNHKNSCKRNILMQEN